MLRVQYVLALWLTLVLVACGGSPAPTTQTPTDGLNLTGQVEGYSGAGGSVAARMQTSLATVAEGTLTAEGLMSIKLPDSLAQNALSTPDVSFPCAAGTLSYTAPDASVDLLAPLAVSEGSQETGTLALRNRAPDAAEGSPVGLKEVFLVYSSVALEVSGVCADADLGLTTTYALTLQPGWNYAVQEVTEENETGTVGTFSSAAAIPEEMKWYFITASVTL